MKFKNLLLVTVVILIAAGIFFSCQEDENQIKGEVTFNIGKLAQSNLKSINVLDSADHVLLTITDDLGNSTDYTLYELELIKFGDEYITEKIALNIGNYQVTEFYVLDKDDNIIYASPLELSVLAQNVDDPLPIIFVIAANVSSTVEVEVLSTENLTPEDFGLFSFPLVEVETFQFLVSVSELGKDQLLKLDLTVSNGSYIYVQNLDSIVNNIVTIKDGYDEYVLEINEAGYETYIDTVTNTALKSFQSIPLTIELVPIESPTVTDIDDNVYQTVQIGNQVWMAENLKTTKYNDGTAIPLVTDNTTWNNLTTPAYCWYNNDETAYKNNGALYNGYILETDNVCPIGWHVPSDAEWLTLENYLITNDYNYDGTTAGNKIAKSLASTTNWTSSTTPGAVGNTDYTIYRNKTGFTALPVGFRSGSGNFNYIGIYSVWWSSTEYSASEYGYWNLYYDGSNLTTYYTGKRDGFSIRCIKD